jgi:hypothetical protein
VFKSLNIIFHSDVLLAQGAAPTLKATECGQFVETLLFVFEYAKENFQESAEVRRLCSEIIVFIGSLCFENQHFQELARTSGLLQAVCNHPLEYLMEPALRNVIIPTYCCLIHANPPNFARTFAENSAQPILQFIQKEMTLSSERRGEEISLGKNIPSRTLSRKTSVSSLNSTYSKAESFSTQTSNSLTLTDS